MSDVRTAAQQQQPTPAPADDTEPTPERRAELQAAYKENVGANKVPYADVAIRTRGELTWLCRERAWSGEVELDPGQARPNLSGARLVGANLSGTRLVGADLSDASLVGANLSGADLAYANLSDASLVGADLSGANLTYANLSSASLDGANLSGADLRQARLDPATVLRGCILTPATQLGDVVWNGAPLTQVDWVQAPRVGDEAGIREAETRSARISAFQDAARAYRGLAVTLRGQGLVGVASGYRLREQRLERAALWHARKYGAWLFSLLLDLVAGYGERPGRIFAAYLAVVVSFAVALGLVTHLVETKLAHLSWDEALVLSLTSFHGRGFFPGSLPLGDWVARLGAAEAVLGLFIELILIATFSKRFLGN